MMLTILLFAVSFIRSAISFVSCPTGYKLCTFADGPYISSGLLSLSNCVYENCPYLILGGDAVLNNVTFKNNNYGANWGPNGGAIFVQNNYNLNLTNVVFQNLYVNGAGSGVFFASSSTVPDYFTNVTFIGNNALNGADMYIASSRTLICNNCVSRNAYTRNNGGFIYGTNSITVIATGGGCYGATAVNWGACFMFDASCNLILNDFDAIGLTSTAGGFGFFNNDMTANLTNVRVYNSSASNQAGCIYAFSHGLINIRDSNFTSCFSPSTGGAFVVQTSITLNLYNTIVAKSKCNGCANAVAFVYGACNFNILQGSKIVETIGSPITISNTNSKLVCDGDSEISDTTNGGSGGAIAFLAGSSGLIGRCSMARNSVSNIGGALVVQDDVFVNITSGARFVGNQAYRGGALHFTGGSSASIGPNVTIMNNHAIAQGGGIYMDTTNNITISGANLVIQGNTAALNPSSGLAYLGKDNQGFILGSTTSEGNVVQGNVYVQYATTAQSILTSSLLQTFPQNTFVGLASTLNIVNADAFGDGIVMNLAQGIPDILVNSLDYFGNPSIVNLQAPVIVKLTEAIHNKTFLGESMKAILDVSTGIVNFTNLRFANNEPGRYRIVISALPGNLVPLPSATEDPYVQIVFNECNPLTERYSSSFSKCLPVIPINSGIRIGFAAIAVIMIIVCIVTMALLFHFREYHVVKANSYILVSVTIVGSILSFISLAIQAKNYFASCILGAWFENIGFTLVFAALLAKMYRIDRIFNHVKRNLNLKDTYLMRYIGLAVILMCSYLITWTFLSAPVPTETLMVDNTISADRCSTSTWSAGIVGIRLFITLIAAVLAYTIRNVPSDFNEAKLIGFATYNWV
ncbi:hypothetical protein ROZALSC1DRAFT_24007, partial [Rozella allomycis CSF55]